MGTWAACCGIIAIANRLLLGIQNFLGHKIVQAYIGGGAYGLRTFVFKITGIYLLLITPLATAVFRSYKNRLQQRTKL